MTTKWKIFRIKGTYQYPDICFNELFHLDLKFKKIKAKYEKDEDEMKSHLFVVPPEEYKPVRVSCDFNI